MPDALPISLPSGISIAKTRHVGPADVSFDVAAQPGSDVLAALLANAPFPLRPIAVGEISAGVTGSRDVPFNGGKGTVTFSGQASGYQRRAVVDEPSEITALLVRDRIQDDFARGLALERKPNHRYVVLRWGYDLQGAAKGAMGLGFGVSATFGAEGKRLGAYAVIRQLPGDLGAASALQAVFDS